MELKLKKTLREEISDLIELEELSFEVNAKYFENGILPPFTKEEKEQYSLYTLYNQNDTELLSIYYGDEIIGCVIIKDITRFKKEILLFFISSKYQGKNLGQRVLKKTEERYPDIRTWRLVTPTQVLRNSVFYINKCGFSIVKVEDYDKEKDFGTFVFEKEV